MVITERAFWKMKELVLGSRLSYRSKQWSTEPLIRYLTFKPGIQSLQWTPALC
jgi:hypothetical protein